MRHIHIGTVDGYDRLGFPGWKGSIEVCESGKRLFLLTAGITRQTEAQALQDATRIKDVFLTGIDS